MNKCFLHSPLGTQKEKVILPVLHFVYVVHKMFKGTKYTNPWRSPTLK